ncbi:MAG: two pore domain potassium channel family protein [Alphaproteobacteria bacterium]|nr:two pore domain potassium channel family protein [Alphaproteobacteria bacterium]
MFVSQLMIGAGLVAVTVIIHALALERLMIVLENVGPAAYKRFKQNWKVPLLIITVLGVFLAHIVQIWLWAFFYLWIGTFHDLETALYFSTSAFTTVGFGDVVLEDQQWRLLSVFQSANGFMLFGWSTAFIFEVMSKLYKGETIRKTEGSK